MVVQSPPVFPAKTLDRRAQARWSGGHHVERNAERLGARCDPRCSIFLALPHHCGESPSKQCRCKLPPVALDDECARLADYLVRAGFVRVYFPALDTIRVPLSVLEALPSRFTASNEVPTVHCRDMALHELL